VKKGENRDQRNGNGTFSGDRLSVWFSVECDVFSLTFTFMVTGIYLALKSLLKKNGMMALQFVL